jgi:hypothetical protein
MFAHGARPVDYLEFAAQLIVGVSAFAYVALPFADSPWAPHCVQTPAVFSPQRCIRDFTCNKLLTLNSMHDQYYASKTVRGNANTPRVDSCSR